MLFSQKNQYALRAIFELAKHRGKGPVKSAAIAEAQNIPVRFLEAILNQLKKCGLVESKRGYTGGFVLASDPADITVGDVFRCIDASLGLVECVACMSSKEECPLEGQCSFYPMWQKVQSAVHCVFEKTSILDLIETPLFASPRTASER